MKSKLFIIISLFMISIMLISCGKTIKQNEELIPSWVKTLFYFNTKKINKTPSVSFLFNENNELRSAFNLFNQTTIDNIYFGFSEFSNQSNLDFIIVMNGEFNFDELDKLAYLSLTFLSDRANISAMIPGIDSDIKQKLSYKEIKGIRIYYLKSNPLFCLVALKKEVLFITYNSLCGKIINTAYGEEENITANLDMINELNSVKGNNLFWMVMNVTDNMRSSTLLKNIFKNSIIGEQPLVDSNYISLACDVKETFKALINFKLLNSISVKTLSTILTTTFGTIKSTKSDDELQNYSILLDNYKIVQKENSVGIKFDLIHDNIKPIIQQISKEFTSNVTSSQIPHISPIVH